MWNLVDAVGFTYTQDRDEHEVVIYKDRHQNNNHYRYIVSICNRNSLINYKLTTCSTSKIENLFAVLKQKGVGIIYDDYASSYNLVGCDIDQIMDNNATTCDILLECYGDTNPLEIQNSRDNDYHYAFITTFSELFSQFNTIPCFQ